MPFVPAESAWCLLGLVLWGRVGEGSGSLAALALRRPAEATSLGAWGLFLHGEYQILN